VQIEIAKNGKYDADQVDSKGNKVKPEGLLPRKTTNFKIRRACFYLLEAYYTNTTYSYEASRLKKEAR
jgi:hypothetical protein